MSDPEFKTGDHVKTPRGYTGVIVGFPSRQGYTAALVRFDAGQRDVAHLIRANYPVHLLTKIEGDADVDDRESAGDDPV